MLINRDLMMVMRAGRKLSPPAKRIHRRFEIKKIAHRTGLVIEYGRAGVFVGFWFLAWRDNS